MPDSVLTPIRSKFRALAETLLPEMASADPAAWTRAEQIIETLLSQRPASVRRQIALFVRVADALPLLRYGRTFRRLDRGRRLHVLRALEDAPILAVRRGVWGLRTLVFMGYYGQPGVREAIGYRAHPDGWAARTRANA